MPNKYINKKITYFSKSEAYQVLVELESDGNLDKWIEISNIRETLVLDKGNRFPFDNLIELRDLLNDVISDLGSE